MIVNDARVFTVFILATKQRWNAWRLNTHILSMTQLMKLSFNNSMFE